MLVVVTFRPEFVPPWAGTAHVTALTLNRLGRRQGGAMVGRVAGGKALPPAEVLEQILARTDGVPLFVEELTKAVLESGLLADEGDRYELAGPLPPLAIPATLQDSLMARLDRLAPVKEVAQVAAVHRPRVPHAAGGRRRPAGTTSCEDALERLVAAELVFRRGEPPGGGYAFKHALVRDAAYQSLLKGRRQQLHAGSRAVWRSASPRRGGRARAAGAAPAPGRAAPRYRQRAAGHQRARPPPQRPPPTPGGARRGRGGVPRGEAGGGGG